MYTINKGSSKNSLAMKWLRHLFWLSAIYNFHLTARHVKGKDNVISDTLSRLDEFNIDVLSKFIETYGLDLDITKHVSQNSYFILLQEGNGDSYRRSVHS